MNLKKEYIDMQKDILEQKELKERLEKQEQKNHYLELELEKTRNEKLRVENEKNNDIIKRSNSFGFSLKTEEPTKYVDQELKQKVEQQEQELKENKELIQELSEQVKELKKKDKRNDFAFEQAKNFGKVRNEYFKEDEEDE